MGIRILDDIRLASGSQLDLYGKELDTYRRTGECDDSYRQSLIFAFNARNRGTTQSNSSQGHNSAFGERFQVGDISKQVCGLTIRDYFAAHAAEKDIMSMVNQHFEDHHKVSTHTGNEAYVPLTRAEARYLWADQMLAVRSKENVQA